ncbi:MAG: hypothetical protein JWP10_1954, partial [Nocardioidaceae bacterium]|nr:hypothetical protein [Nocardioidaceae bacterium]
RIERQQNFLRATMSQLLSKGTFTNPLRLTNVLSAVTQNIVIDQAWENGDIRALALAMRGVTVKNVKFMTLPIAGYGNDKTNGSYLRVDEAKAQELWTAMKSDNVDAYLTKYPKAALGKAKNVE